jgi:hypothetical protein
MKHKWFTDDKIQDDGRVLATCSLCDREGEVIYIFVYPLNCKPGDGPIKDDCPGKKTQ